MFLGLGDAVFKVWSWLVSWVFKVHYFRFVFVWFAALRVGFDFGDCYGFLVCFLVLFLGLVVGVVFGGDCGLLLDV